MARILQQVAKLFEGQPGVSDNPTHRKGIHGVVTRNGENTLAVGEHDMLALACDPKTNPSNTRTASGWLTLASFGTGYATSTSRMSASLNGSSRTAR